MNPGPADNPPAQARGDEARKRKPRAALFFYEGFISVSPSVAGTAQELLARGYCVDIFYNSPPIDVPPPNLPPEIRLHEHTPWTRWITGPIINMLRHKALRRISRKRVDEAVQKESSLFRAWAKALVIFLEFPQFALFCRRHYEAADLLIAFDMTGLAAMSWTVPAQMPFIYWSLEITPLVEATDLVSRWLKRHELRRLPEAQAIVVQAPERRALFERDIRLPLDRYVEVSNGPSQPVPSGLAENFFHGKFPIPPEAHVVLHAGLISPSYLSLEVAHTVPAWPQEFVLVFHERQHRSPKEPYLQAVQQSGGERVFLSLEPVPFDQVDLVYAGAYIGLVCYSNMSMDTNQTTAWASSGKLVYCLRHGLPIVVVSSAPPPVLTDWLCGVWTPSVDGVGPALAKIAADYEAYTARARQAYDALFDFNAAFDGLMAKVAGN
jgi:hypothetical protein